MEKLLNIAQTANMIGISRSMVYQLVDRHRINVYRVGRRCLFSPKMIEVFLESRLVRADVELEEKYGQ